MKPYRWLAKYYDQVFSPLRGPLDAARSQVLGAILPQVESACDLACGTGTTALTFARLGIATYGVDLSPMMCQAAREKARRAGLPLRVIRGDMRSFRLPKPVGLVTCEFDAVNHVPRKSDLGRVVRAVARALRPGGWFYFDVNNAHGFRRNWCGDGWFERPGVVMVMRSRHNRQADRAWSDVEWFIREGKRWRRRSEHVEEVCWEAAEIRRKLREAGFDRVRAWDAKPLYKGDPVIRPGSRTIYLAWKAGGSY